MFRKPISTLGRVASPDRCISPLFSISRIPSTEPGMPKFAQVERQISRKGAKRSLIGFCHDADKGEEQGSDEADERSVN